MTMRCLAVHHLAVALLLSAAVCAGCRSEPTQSAPHTVSYQLEWAWEGAAPEPGGSGWQTTNDRGYRVRVERGYLVNYNMELVECPKEAQGPDVMLWTLIPVRAAWAGHAPTTPNPAAIYTPHIEALHAPINTEVGSKILAAQRYCRVHYLIARSNRAAVGLPDDVDMVERSLYVKGTYQAASADAPKPFELATSSANAILTELFPPGQFGAQAAALVVDTGHENARVVIRRRLKSLFDGVDFEAMPAVRIERQILQNVIDGTEIAVQRSDR